MELKSSLNEALKTADQLTPKQLEKRKKTNLKIFKIFGIIFAVVLGVAAITIIVNPEPKNIVPNVVGKPLPEAKKLLGDNRFSEVETKADSDKSITDESTWKVTKQSPAAGTKTRSTTKITLTATNTVPEEEPKPKEGVNSKGLDETRAVQECGRAWTDRIHTDMPGSKVRVHTLTGRISVTLYEDTFIPIIQATIDKAPYTVTCRVSGSPESPKVELTNIASSAKPLN